MTNEEAKRYWTAKYEAARNWDDPHWEASERKDHRRYVDALKAAIEALSERTGEWILVCDSEGEGDNLYRCSECGCEYGCQEYDKPNFCPNCGADMRGEQDG